MCLRYASKGFLSHGLIVLKNIPQKKKFNPGKMKKLEEIRNLFGSVEEIEDLI